MEQYRGSELPRFGMSTKPGKAVRIGRWGGMRRTRSVRPPFELAMGGCNLSMCSSADSRGICKMGSLLVPRRQFLRGIGSLVVCAPAVVRSSSLMRISARFCVSGCALPPRAIDSGRSRPACSTKWSVDSPKRCLARIAVQRRRKTQSCSGAPSSQKPRLQRCGNSGLGLGLEVRPPNHSKICPLKSGPVFCQCSGAAPTQALGHGRRGSPASLRAKAVSAPFDNPSRSWDIKPQARSLDCARG